MWKIFTKNIVLFFFKKKKKSRKEQSPVLHCDRHWGRCSGAVAHMQLDLPELGPQNADTVGAAGLSFQQKCTSLTVFIQNGWIHSLVPHAKASLLLANFGVHVLATLPAMHAHMCKHECWAHNAVWGDWGNKVRCHGLRCDLALQSKAFVAYLCCWLTRLSDFLLVTVIHWGLQNKNQVYMSPSWMLHMTWKTCKTGLSDYFEIQNWKAKSTIIQMFKTALWIDLFRMASKSR